MHLTPSQPPRVRRHRRRSNQLSQTTPKSRYSQNSLAPSGRRLVGNGLQQPMRRFPLPISLRFLISRLSPIGRFNHNPIKSRGLPHNPNPLACPLCRLPRKPSPRRSTKPQHLNRSRPSRWRFHPSQLRWRNLLRCRPLPRHPPFRRNPLRHPRLRLLRQYQFLPSPPLTACKLNRWRNHGHLRPKPSVHHPSSTIHRNHSRALRLTKQFPTKKSSPKSKWNRNGNRRRKRKSFPNLRRRRLLLRCS